MVHLRVCTYVYMYISCSRPPAAVQGQCSKYNKGWLPNRLPLGESGKGDLRAALAAQGQVLGVVPEPLQCRLIGRGAHHDHMSCVTSGWYRNPFHFGTCKTHFLNIRYNQ